MIDKRVVLGLLSALLCGLFLFSAQTFTPSPPVGGGAATAGGGGLTPPVADATYLRLDTSNDPLTGELAVDNGTCAAGGPYAVGSTGGGTGFCFSESDGTFGAGIGLYDDADAIFFAFGNDNAVIPGFMGVQVQMNVSDLAGGGEDVQLGSTLGYTWTADPDTGFRNSSANSVAIQTGGVDSIFVNSFASQWQTRLSFLGVLTGSTLAPNIGFQGGGGGGIYWDNATDELNFVFGSTDEYQFESDTMRAPDGTVGAPGYAFTGDPDTGLFLPLAGAVTLAIGGTGVWSCVGSTDCQFITDITPAVDDSSALGTVARRYSEAHVSDFVALTGFRDPVTEDPGCNSTNHGRVYAFEDTDTSGRCICAKKSSAPTYDWEALNQSAPCP